MKKNNQFLNLSFNIVIPVIILNKLSKEEYLGPLWGLLVALAFPLFFGLYELVIQKQKSTTSMIGFAAILLTGIIGVMKFPPHWIAVKEAAIPLILGLVVLVSTNKRWQIVTKFFYNREILDIDKIEDRLKTNGLKVQLDRKLSRANLFIAFSLFFSAALNYFLAKIVVTSMPGTTQFNEEIGQMTMLNFPVIVIPLIVIMLSIIWYVFSSIKNLTQLSSNEIISEKFRTEK